jgi:subtilisin family serine protease
VLLSDSSKGGKTMKRLISVSILIVLIVGLSVPAMAAKNTVAGPAIDVIVLADGDTGALVKHIQSLGGVVKIQYRNVPAVAAAIPADKMGAVARFGGVTSIEKDGLMYPADEPASGLTGAHPTSFEVQSAPGVNVRSVGPVAIDAGTLPEGYANFMYTGAALTWEDTFYGEGSIVAVVDTGTYPNVCLEHAVIGAPGFPDGFNSTDDGVLATSIDNYYHGTHVAGVIASSCTLSFTEPDDPLAVAIATHLPWDPWGDGVPVLGQAPLASIYPVKVFDYTGAGSPTSLIVAGLDHVLTLKTEGLLDIDIVNMSLGGGALWDGREAYDRFIEELGHAGMLVVTSAGNDGPVPNSVGSPATSYGAVSVGALDYPASSRVLYEFLALRAGMGPGMGMVMRPSDDVRVINFSSRGPLSDGRFGPEILALGMWNFHLDGDDILRWAGGTSFSAPTVAGAAALLNAYWEGLGYETAPVALENVLLKGANPDVVAEAWQGINDQGYGTLDVPASLALLMAGDVEIHPAKKVGELKADILGKPVKGKTQTWESDMITVGASEPFNAVFEIGPATSKVLIEVFDITTEDNSAYAWWPNALEVHLQSAKRTSIAHPVEVLWDPYAYGDAFDIVVEDGPWTFWDIPWDYMPMEEGLMKLSLVGDYSNEAPVSFKVRVTRENFREPLENRVANGVIKTDDTMVIPVEIPEGATMATFDLTWHRDWNSFPTADLDLLLFDPTLALVSLDAATLNAPERAVIDAPAAGTWYAMILGYQVDHPDNYDLYLNIE